MSIPGVLKLHSKRDFSCLQLDSNKFSTYLLNKKFKLCIAWFPNLEIFSTFEGKM